MDAVVFDLFGTLIHNVPRDAFHGAVDEITTILGADRKPLLDVLGGQFSQRMDGSIPDGPEQFRPLVRALGLDRPDDVVADAGRAWRDFFARTFTPKPDAFETLDALRERGLRLAIASDCSSGTPDLVDGSGLGAYFEASAYSAFVGVTKPDERMYRRVLDGLGVEGSRCVYVGDGNSNELPGAQRHGMTTVWVDNGEAQHWRVNFCNDADHTVTNLVDVVGIVERALG